MRDSSESGRTTLTLTRRTSSLAQETASTRRKNLPRLALERPSETFATCCCLRFSHSSCSTLASSLSRHRSGSSSPSRTPRRCQIRILGARKNTRRRKRTTTTSSFPGVRGRYSYVCVRFQNGRVTFVAHLRYIKTRETLGDAKKLRRRSLAGEKRDTRSVKERERERKKARAVLSLSLSVFVKKNF